MHHIRCLQVKQSDLRFLFFYEFIFICNSLVIACYYFHCVILWYKGSTSVHWFNDLSVFVYDSVSGVKE